MPVTRFALLLLAVIAAAGLTVALAAFLAPSLPTGATGGLAAAVLLAALVVHLAWSKDRR